MFFVFQFHYDLILFHKLDQLIQVIQGFQFHYDLILFYNTVYFIIFIRFNFNFIMILFYSEQTTHDTIMLDIFQFHYDLILL